MHLLALVLLACGQTAPSEPGKADHPQDREEKAKAGGSAKLDLAGTIAYTGPITAQALFVSVKDPAHPGPPLAAKKLDPGPFPMAFTLTNDDLMPMGGGREVPETVLLTVTLDGDGNPMSKDPADPKASLEVPATSAGLTVNLTAGP